jgi:Tfp pilus assembly protein PilF
MTIGALQAAVALLQEQHKAAFESAMNHPNHNYYDESDHYPEKNACFELGDQLAHTKQQLDKALKQKAKI